MNAAQVVEIQRRVIGQVREARSGLLADLEERANTIWSNTARLTVEARRNDVALELVEGRSGIEASLEPGPSTRRVHAGEEPAARGAIHKAPYDHSAFGFSSTADLMADPAQAPNGGRQ
ncbi:MAG: hypothetical protein M3N18_06265 [Actinomycetota bacterium]|nr:hypothetical protein [Actinomycetota bacterium]